MKQSTPTPKLPLRHRQIGRKVLLADRLSHALGSTESKKANHLLGFLKRRPKTIALTCAVVACAGILGLTTVQFYTTKAEAAQKAAATEKQAKLAKKSIAAEACRRKKAEQKADLIGKVTYDQLYDYDECDK